MIHTNPHIWRNVLTDVFVSTTEWHVVLWLFVLFGSAISIFLVCALIEYARKALFGLFKPERRIVALFLKAGKKSNSFKTKNKR